MSRPTADHALRRLVADVAALHADDVAAILDGLDAKERKTIEDVLGEYTAYFGDDSKRRTGDHRNFDASQFSAWLAQRLQSDNQSDFAMTDHARQALCDCATRLFSTAPERRAS